MFFIRVTLVMVSSQQQNNDSDREYISVCLLVVYRKAIDFCKLILYLATLLNLFIVSKSFLIQFWGSLMFTIMSSTKRDSLTSFPICIPLLSFLFLFFHRPHAYTKNYRQLSNAQKQSSPGTSMSSGESTSNGQPQIQTFNIQNIIQTEQVVFMNICT